MRDLKEFIMIQRHNHMVLEMCTMYEDEALEAIAEGNMDKYETVIKSLNEAQKNYRDYISSKNEPQESPVAGKE